MKIVLAPLDVSEDKKSNNSDRNQGSGKVCNLYVLDINQIMYNLYL